MALSSPAWVSRCMSPSKRLVSGSCFRGSSSQSRCLSTCLPTTQRASAVSSTLDIVWVFKAASPWAERDFRLCAHAVHICCSLAASLHTGNQTDFWGSQMHRKGRQDASSDPQQEYTGLSPSRLTLVSSAGTCTNDKKDECRLPGGATASSCSEMSLHWKVPNQPSCQGPPPTPTSVVPKPSPTPCPPSPLCQLIISE